jgi:hypothetical protein
MKDDSMGVSRIMVFTPGKPQGRKEQVPKCRSKVAPHFGNYKPKKCLPKSEKTPPIYEEMIDHEVRHFKKQDAPRRRQLKIARSAQRNEDLNFDAHPKSAIFADRCDSLFSSPAQAAD